MADNTRAAWRFLRGKGLTPAQAAGVIGSMQGESGKNLDPAAVNPNGGATGIAQWLGARKTAAVETKQLGPQLNHLWQELQGPERGALQALKGARTPEQAAIAWQRQFERGAPFEQKYNMRAANARDVFNRLGGVGGDPSAGAAGAPGASTTEIPGATIKTTVPTVDQQGFQAAQQKALVGQLIARRNPNSFLLRSGLLSTVSPSLSDFQGSQTITDTIPGKTVIKPGSQIADGATADVAKVIERANILNSKHLPYRWGGGHQAKVVDVRKAAPVDCSGAVSAVLGINPRVSGQFTAWGSPGDGGSRGITVAANSHHVLMKINGHWFGTSGTNPGGGAGWIPASAISPQYLRGFTLRHSNG